jgi:hypothetical protein
MQSFVRVALALALLSPALAGCMSDRFGAPAQAPRSYPPPSPNPIWARADGQRMAGNPALLAKGQQDRSECQDRASASGELDFQAFSACMYGRGYYRADVTS